VGVWVCVCVCVFVRVHVRTYACVCLHVRVRLRVRVRVRVRVSVCVFLLVHVCGYGHAIFNLCSHRVLPTRYTLLPQHSLIASIREPKKRTIERTNEKTDKRDECTRKRPVKIETERSWGRSSFLKPPLPVSGKIDLFLKNIHAQSHTTHVHVQHHVACRCVEQA